MPGDVAISADDPIEGSWNGFRFQVNRPEDTSAILDQVREEFCKDEPFCNFYNSSQTVVDGVVEFGREGLVAGPQSVIAYDEKTGELAGVRLSKIITKEENEKAKNAKYTGDFLTVFELLHYMLSIVKPVNCLYQKYSVDKLYQYRILSVGSKFRQRGLALELCLRSLRLAKKEGCSLAMVYFTSKFSTRVGEKLGFQLESAIKYDDYKVDGKVVYNNMGVHEAVSLMTKSF